MQNENDGKRYLSPLEKIDEILKLYELKIRENKGILKRTVYLCSEDKDLHDILVINYSNITNINLQELWELVRLMKEMDLIIINGSSSSYVDCDYDYEDEKAKKAYYISITFTLKSWERLATLNSGIGNQAFVAIWFHPDMKEAFKAIEKACNECQFRALKIDDKEHNHDVNFEIIAEIKRSKFLIAEFTGEREGVYYEAGLARGLGLEVV